RTSQGELIGSCPKVPSDLEAKIGYHVDTQNPSKAEAVFGYVHLKTTDLNRELGLELPLVPHPLLILGYSRFNFVRASSILNCQSTPRCLALVLSAQSPISDWSKGSSPMRRSVRHGLLRQLNSHSATFNQLPCFGV